MSDVMLDEFYIEAEELFSEAEDALLAIETSSDPGDCYNLIFRSFHSIKGAAGMFGLDALQQHMHFLENLLEKNGAENLNGEYIDYFLSGIDAAKNILAGKEVDFQYRSQQDQDESAKVPKLSPEEQSIIDVMKKNAYARKQNARYAGHVVIIDDEEDLLDILKLTLEEKGLKVSAHSDVDKALKQVQEDRSIDLVLSDYVMPQMNGVEVLQEVNKLKPLLPCVILSGFLDKDVCLHALSAGVSGLVEKPVDIDILMSQLQISINKYNSFKLLKKSIDLLVYQFEDFDNFLKESNSEDQRKVFRKELKTLLSQKKILEELWKD